MDSSHSIIQRGRSNACLQFGGRPVRMECIAAALSLAEIPFGDGRAPAHREGVSKRLGHARRSGRPLCGSAGAHQAKPGGRAVHSSRQLADGGRETDGRRLEAGCRFSSILSRGGQRLFVFWFQTHVNARVAAVEDMTQRVLIPRLDPGRRLSLREAQLTRPSPSSRQRVRHLLVMETVPSRSQ